VPKKSSRERDDKQPAWRRYWRAYVVVVALGGFAGVIWYSYAHGVRAGNAASLPLVRADLSPIKVAPSDPGGLKVPHKDIMVYDRLDGGATHAGDRVEHLVVPEDPVLPRRAPPAEDHPADKAALPAAEAPAEKATPPGLAPVKGGEDAAPVQSAQYMGPFRVQLAAYRTPEAAAEQWRKISSKQSDLLGKLNPVIQRADLGGKGIFYRLQAGPLKSRNSAAALCEKLKQRKVSCLVVQL